MLRLYIGPTMETLTVTRAVGVVEIAGIDNENDQAS